MSARIWSGASSMPGDKDPAPGGATARPGIIRRLAPSVTVIALWRTAAHSSSLAGACSIGFPWSMSVFTAFHTTSTLGSITLFIPSRIDATGLYGGAEGGGGAAGAGFEQPASRHIPHSTTAGVA